MVTKNKCFYCGEADHMVRDCQWKNMPCISVGCGYKMNLMVSKVEKSYGCRFLRCKNQPMCNAFKWVDEPAKQGPTAISENRASTSDTSDMNKAVGTECTSKVKVVKEKDGVKLTFEGNVDDVIELMKKTKMY